MMRFIVVTALLAPRAQLARLIQKCWRRPHVFVTAKTVGALLTALFKLVKVQLASTNASSK